MARIAFDDRRFPVLQLRYPRNLEPHDVLNCFAEWDDYFSRGPHVLVVDMRNVNPLSLGVDMRKTAALEIEKRRELFTELLLAEGRVFANPLVRYSVTAFDWIVGHKFTRPVRNFERIEDAEAFVLPHLPRAVV